MTSITEQAMRLKQQAHAGPIGKRHSSFELYALLADCMALAERCRNGPAYEEMRRLVADTSPTDNKRRYVERGSDEFILVCRYVFPNGSRSAERSNASRYAHCLREASKRQIRPWDLENVLKTKGGLNTLYMQRPLTRTTVQTKALRLTRSIDVPKHEEFTLTLRRTPDNTFDIVDMVRISDGSRNGQDRNGLGGASDGGEA